MGFASEAERIAFWRATYPDYCPDDLVWDEVCAACGASPLPAVPGNYCHARHNGPRPRALVEIILTDKLTGERI